MADKNLKWYAAYLFVILLSSACMQKPILTHWLATAIPTESDFLPTVSVETIELIVADQNYLNGCLKLNPNKYNQQASYNAILPGITTMTEVEKLVGIPESKSNLVEEWWEYHGYGVRFDAGVVYQVNVGWYEENDLNLIEIIKKYGCPDLIIAADGKEEKTGTLDMLTFVYANIGVDFQIYNFPAGINDLIVWSYYYVPMTLHDYVYQMRDMYESTNAVKVVSWKEAVTK